MDTNATELEMRMFTLISSICGLFSHEQANSLLTRSFPDCKDIKHKTDCMRTVLEKACKHPDIFFSKLNSIIRLHSNILVQKPELLEALNQELRIINLSYDLGKIRLEILPGFEPYLIVDPFLDIDKDLIRDEFYKSVINEINWCFGTRAYSSMMVMIRKLFENLVKDLLRNHFKSDLKKTHYYWKKNQFISFNKLIENLESKIAEFEQYSQKIDSDLIAFLRAIKYTGNESAHTIEDSITLDHLEKLKKRINYKLKLLLRVIK